MSNGFKPNDFEWPPNDLKQDDPIPNIVLYTQVYHWEEKDVHLATVNLYGGARVSNCSKAEIVFFSGTGNTDKQGVWEIDIEEIHCRDKEFLYGTPTMVATPFSKYPRTLTVTYQRRNEGKNLKLQVYSWLPSGDKIGFTSFSWHCLVPIELDVDLI